MSIKIWRHYGMKANTGTASTTNMKETGRGGRDNGQHFVFFWVASILSGLEP